MQKAYQFEAVIIKHEGINGAFIEFPYDVETDFGTKGLVKVRATFDGYEYRGSLAKMGYKCHILGLTQKIRSEIGKQPGDTVHVVLEKDDAPRVAELPEDFRLELEKDAEAESFFKSQSYTHQKEYVVWIESAKKAETRQKRIQDAIRLLHEKKHAR